MQSLSHDAENLKPRTSLRFVAAAMVVCFQASIAFQAWAARLDDE